MTSAPELAVQARRQRQQSKHWWRRLERQAIAGYERDLLADLRGLADGAGEIQALECRPGVVGEVVRLHLPGRLLTIVGVLPETVAAVSASAGPLRITSAGRYGRTWWVTLSNAAMETVVGGCRLRLTSFDSGTPHRGTPGLGAPPMTV
jgi:hypothetical protein